MQSPVEHIGANGALGEGGERDQCLSSLGQVNPAFYYLAGLAVVVQRSHLLVSVNHFCYSGSDSAQVCGQLGVFVHILLL